jgi:hypothetical protein
MSMLINNSRRLSQLMDAQNEIRSMRGSEPSGGVSTLLAVLLPAVRRPAGLASDLRVGAWFLSYEALLLGVSAIGTFGGSGVLPAPWDSLVVGLGALAVYRWAIRSGRVWSATRVQAPVGEVAEFGGGN